MNRIILTFAAVLIAGAAIAQTATQPNMAQQLQGLLGNSKGQSNIGQVLAMGTLLGCTEKQVGKEKTNAFYQEMQTVGKTVEGYCKQGQPAQARDLVLNTVNAKHADPVVHAALGCYESQTQSLNQMAGPKTAADAARYARWVKNPATAQKEMAETDICKNSLKTSAPVPVVN